MTMQTKDLLLMRRHIATCRIEIFLFIIKISESHLLFLFIKFLWYRMETLINSNKDMGLLCYMAFKSIQYNYNVLAIKKSLNLPYCLLSYKINKYILTLLLEVFFCSFFYRLTQIHISISISLYSLHNECQTTIFPLSLLTITSEIVF